jgi:putative SOS response-associated peptidase YedK
MCGRYASSRKPGDLVDELDVDEAWIDSALDPSWNVAPTDEVYVVVERGREDAPPERQLRTARWGLVPSWAKDPSVGSRMINARMETLAEKPAYRRAFAKRRCLVPADGYFEWYATSEVVRGKAVKQPFFIHPADGSVLAMAGLYEFWVDPAKAEDDPTRWLWSCTVVTTTAEDGLGRIHDRMPLMVERDRWAEWLDPARPGTLDLLTPAMPGRLEAFPVAPLVNSVRNNGPELVAPLPIEETEEAVR